MESNQPLAPDMIERRNLLQRYQHIAIVGMSARQQRPSYAIATYLQAHGYNIIFINPRYAGQTLLGKHVYASLTEAREAGEQIEIVDVFRKASETLAVAEEAIKVGAQAVWLQLGIRNDDTGTRVQEAGLVFVQDHCIKVEHAHLLA